MKRILSLVLSLLMLASLCTGIAVAEEPRVLTIGSCVSLGEEFINYDVFKTVQEELNMTIQVTEYNEDSFSAMIAGGDLPDIVMASSNILKINNLFANDLALDIAPLLEEYAPNMLNNEVYAAATEFCKLRMSDDGGLYVICPCVGIHNADGGSGISTRGYIVNWEWYKELGMPEINNDEDYFNVLMQMWQNHPTNDEGDPTYLMGVEKAFTDMGGYRACFTNEISLNTWCPYLYKNNIFTNEVVNGYTDVENSHYWTDMAFYNKCYRVGGFDLDSFTMSYDEYKAKRAAEQYMGLYYGTTDDYIPVPSAGSNWYANVVMLTGQAPSYYAFISANSENWDLALKFYNYIYDLDFARTWYSGVEGKDWYYNEDGVPVMTDEALAAIASGEDPYWDSEGNGYNYRNYVLSGYNPGVLHTDGYPLDLTLSADSRIKAQNAKHQNFAADYGVELWSDAYNSVEGAKDFRNSAEGLAGGLADMPLDMQRTLEACNDVLYTSMPLLIMAESEEEFAEIQAEVLAEVASLGEAEVWEWYQAEWENAKPIYNELLVKALRANGIEPYEGLE